MRLLTAHSHNYWPLAKVTIPNKIECAGRHGFDFVSETHENKNLCWERVEHWMDWLPGSNWLLFMACDVACTNPNINPCSLIDDQYDFIIACDGNGLQSDSWLMRDCEATRAFLTRVRAWEGSGTHEQDAMYFELAGVSCPSEPIPNRVGPFLLWDQTEFIKNHITGFHCNPKQFEVATIELNRSSVRTKVMPQRLINAYPTAHYKGFGVTGEEEWSWHPGDFACHMVAKPNDYRVEHLSKILEMRP